MKIIEIFYDAHHETIPYRNFGSGLYIHLLTTLVTELTTIFIPISRRIDEYVITFVMFEL